MHLNLHYVFTWHIYLLTYYIIDNMYCFPPVGKKPRRGRDFYLLVHWCGPNAWKCVWHEIPYSLKHWMNKCVATLPNTLQYFPMAGGQNPRPAYKNSDHLASSSSFNSALWPMPPHTAVPMNSLNYMPFPGHKLNIFCWPECLCSPVYLENTSHFSGYHLDCEALLDFPVPGRIYSPLFCDPSVTWREF